MPLYDEFDDPKSEGTFSRLMNMFERRQSVGARRPLVALSVVGSLFVLLVAVLWISYPRGTQGLNGEVPIIRADASPVKVAPESQGGMDIPYRESTVFDTMRGQAPDGKVENLLPQSERPLDRSKVFAGLKTDAPQTAVKQEGPTDLTEANTTAAANLEPASSDTDATKGAPEPSKTIQIGDKQGFAPQASPTTPTASDSPVKTSVPAMATGPAPDETQGSTNGAVATNAPTALTKAPESLLAPQGSKPVSDKLVKSAPAVKNSAVLLGHDYIQIAAIKDRATAPAVWKRMQGQFPTQLSGQSYRIDQATVKGNNFFRIQAGPMSANNAHSACRAINVKKAGACLVVGG